MNKRADDHMDPVVLEILHNALKSVVDEMYIALMRSAYSTNIKERNDHSTALIDPAGRLVVQAENSLPIHLSSMVGLMENLLKKFKLEDMRPGDIFIGNDPHVAGGSHLPDINLAMPVFHGEDLVAFVCNIAHHADIGGMVPGSVAGGMSEIYQEGLRIPVIRLFRGGEVQQDVFDLLLLNVRVPHERWGDYNAQVASCRLGERRLHELATRYSVATLRAGFDSIIKRTERRLRSAVATLPDGVYTFSDVVDDDGMGNVDILVAVTIEVTGDRIVFDFEGTADQTTGNINVPFNATQATVCYAVKALLDPEVPNNQGVINVCDTKAPRGSLVNCVSPAPVAARASTAQRIVDVIIGAFAETLPEAVVGAANGANTAAVFSGKRPTDGADYLYLETQGGGFGGRATRDGTDGVQVHSTNTSNLPIEAIELEYPLRVEVYEFITDSGGSGKYRGGLGLRRVLVPVDHNCTFSGQGERFRHAPWGLFGATSGRTGKFAVIRADGNEEVLDVKPSGVIFGPQDKLVVETPGAGGYGKPSDRSAAKIRTDLDSGKFSREFVTKHYGSSFLTVPAKE